MLLTIRTTLGPAGIPKTPGDLGFLLHKHPGRVQSFDLSFGRALVFYPELTETACTAAMLLEVDPVGFVRKSGRPAAGGLDQYVNDRPYVASSLMSVAIGRVFGTALAGRCKDRPDLVDQSLPLTAKIAVLPARRGGEELIRTLFEPLGYTIDTQPHPLDERFPSWGESPYFTVTLSQAVPLRDLLTHLYVLIPVLDDEKHYWVGQDEIEKLLAKGEGWLTTHPSKELITSRYLKHFRGLTRDALARLMQDEQPEVDEQAAAQEQAEAELEQAATKEKTVPLNQQRHEAVIKALKDGGAKSVLDLGCAQGRLLRRLLADRQFERIVGLDVSLAALERAEQRLHLDRLPDRQKERVRLLHGSLMYRDRRLEGFDAACLIEVLEHFDPPRLTTMERSVFEFARPTLVVVTTPNIEYNVRFETLAAGRLRHGDHRFEWTREQFRQWAEGVAERHGYAVRFACIGPEDPDVGSPTQMAVFEADHPAGMESPS